MPTPTSEGEGEGSPERDRSPLLVPVWLERTSGWAQRLLVIGLASGAVFWLALQIRVALVPFLIAVVFAAALRPAASRFERLGMPRSLASTLPLALVGAVLGLAGWFIYHRTRRTLGAEEYTSVRVRERVEEWLTGEPFELTPEQIADTEQSIRSWLSAGVNSLGVEQATLAVQVVAGLLLTLVLTFFLVKDGPAMWTGITSKISPLRRDAVHRSGTAAATTMSAYVRSIVITGIADALLIGLGLAILGVPLVVPLMILTALAGLFPLVGAVVAGAAAALVALVAVGPSTALWVVVLTLVVQQVEGNVLQPMIVARRVSIHPVVVLVSLTAGGAAAGLAGAFLAVPVVAATISAVQAFSAQMDTPPARADTPTSGEPLADVPDASRSAITSDSTPTRGTP